MEEFWCVFVMDELEVLYYVDGDLDEYYDDFDEVLLYEYLEKMFKYGWFFYMF